MQKIHQSMKIFYFLCLLLSFSIVNCCTTRTARAKIKNRSGHKILSATLSHRYSDVFNEANVFGVLEDGKDSTDYLSVRYNTGVGCDGNDWWLITWVIDDGTIYNSDPNNGQCWLSILADAASDLLGAFSSVAGGLTRELLSASLQLSSTITKYTVNGGDFCGYKAYTLTSSDDNSEVNIILLPYANNGVKWESPSGSATTNYKILDIYPGFSVKPNVDLSGNDIGDPANIPISSSASACCNLCFMDSRCQAYTWNSNNHKCFFKAYSSGIGTPNSIAQSGVRQSGAAYFAVQNDWDFAGNDLTSSIVSSYTDCAMKCANNPACKTFTMLKSNNLCLLKSSAGNGGVYKSNLLSGYQGDYTEKFKRQSSVDIIGNDLGDTSNPPVVDSYAACASLCYLTGGQCHCFTWNSQNRKCFLKTAHSGHNMKWNVANSEAGILAQSFLIPNYDYNHYGKWYNFEYCPRGSWAYGFKQRVESDQGIWTDDTALNAIRLYCRTNNGISTGSISSYDGEWGDWSNDVYCGENSQFMVSVNMKVEDTTGSDATGVNSFKSRCRDVVTNTISGSYLEANNGAKWGDWKGEVICPQGTAICAISSKFDRAGGLRDDDVGMTEAQFICCPLFDCSPHVMSTLGNNGILNAECSIRSDNGAYYAIMQKDGNFVIYTTDVNRVLTASNTMGNGKFPRRLVMQDDGNLVIYDGNGGATWASNTMSKGQSPYRLVMGDDGNLVIYDRNGQATWSAGSVLIHGSIYGGSGGGGFNDLDNIGSSSRYYPQSITIRSDSSINAIQITYQTQSGQVQVAPKRGGDGGTSYQFNLDPDERIIKVTGAFGSLVTRLQFTTNKGRISPTYGGSAPDTSFSEQYPGYVLSYISGKSGSLVDQIQFHWIHQD